MPSPFPGMDPYLEDRAVFPDLHNALAYQIRDALNAILPAPYYAQLESRQELGIMDVPRPEQRVPDVAVSRDPWTTGGSNVATMTISEARTELSPSIDLDVEPEPLDVSFVEIRDADVGHELVTLVEILSPSNKLAGDDRAAYLRKRAGILASTTSLIEIDLLRSGERIWNEAEYRDFLSALSPLSRYLVVVNRSWKRRKGPRRSYQLFPVLLSDLLPVFPVPLREGEPEPRLDLQLLFRRAYDGGPYRRGRINYRAVPPPPPLTSEELAWVREQVSASTRSS